MISRRGEIFIVDFDPVKGHEQAKKRPAVVISRPEAAATLGMVAVIPMTSRNRGWLWHTAVQPTSDNGLSVPSYVMAEQLRWVDIATRVKGRLGQMDADTLDEVDRKIRLLFGWPTN